MVMIFFLGQRMLRGDMIEMYNYVKGINKIDNQCLFPMVKVSKNRGYRCKVRGKRFEGNLRGKYFRE